MSPHKPGHEPEGKKHPYIPEDVTDHVRLWVEGVTVRVAWSDGLRWFELGACTDVEDAYSAIEKAARNVRRNRELRREFE